MFGLPQKLNKEEKAMVEKMKSSENFQPSPTAKDKGWFERMRDHFRE